MTACDSDLDLSPLAGLACHTVRSAASTTFENIYGPQGRRQYLRAQADVQNMRRRTDEDMAKTRKFAIEGFAESLLPVLDSLEAGLAVQNASPEQLREGAEATLRQLTSALERNKVLAIAPAAGTKFDPHQHQAISMVPAEQEANTVVSVLQKGYQIAERVLRPALVTVAAPK